jgi:hypothetical protein
MFACCAFAVFLLQQLLAPLFLLRERLFGKAPPRVNGSVLWAPGAVAAPPPVRLRAAGRPAFRPALVLVLALETLAVGGSVAAATLATRAAQPSAEQRFLIALHATICHAVGRPPS